MENVQALPILRDVTPLDAAEWVGLAQRTLGLTWTEDYVLWKYFGNPAGQVYGCRAELEDRPVGFYSNLPLRLKVGRRTVPAAQAVDAMVAPEMRRQGLFVKMAQQTYERMDRDGIVLTYGFSNPAAQAGHLTRLSWILVGAVPRYLKVLDAGAASRARGLKGFKALGYRSILGAVRLVAPRRVPLSRGIVRVREVDGFDARFDALWAEAAGDFPTAVVRDAAYLGWRYLQNPLVDYRILVAERGGALAGYTVLSLRDLEKDGTVALAELLVAPGDWETGLVLLAESESSSQHLGGVQLQCWMVPQRAFYRELLVRSGFVYWPLRFLPRVLRYTTSFIVRTSAGTELSPDPGQLGNWFLTMGDQDYY
jgi:GNAT superfamily N-acetyltransferase